MLVCGLRATIIVSNGDGFLVFGPVMLMSSVTGVSDVLLYSKHFE
jgi:hypothetical protein